jgi:hypothetical protein
MAVNVTVDTLLDRVGVRLGLLCLFNTLSPGVEHPWEP